MHSGCSKTVFLYITIFDLLNKIRELWILDVYLKMN